MTSNTETDEKINAEKTDDDNVVSTTLTVGKELKIVDLNNGLTNFESTFTVKSIKKEPFKLVAVNEKALDDVSKLEYKLADQGVISGQIFSDIDVPNNFILVLVANDEIETDVEIDITRNEIKPWSRTPKPKQQEQPQKQPENANPQTQQSNQKPDVVKPQKNPPPKKLNSVEKYENTSQAPKSFFTKYRIALIILLVVCLIAFCVYWFWPRSKGEKMDLGNNLDIESTTIPSLPQPNIVTTPNIGTDIAVGLDSDLLNNLESVKLPSSE
jgi:hypothetical protein